MSQGLVDLLAGSQGDRGIRVWLKSSAYTSRLLLGEAGDPWRSAAEYLAYFSQAHGLLRPDVAVVEVGELYDSWLASHPELQVELGAKRKVSFPLRKLLEPIAPREVLAEVLGAVVAHLRGQVPLVLAMPSPRAWLYRANLLAGRDDIDPESGDIEDAAMYVADLLRSVSQLPIAGLLFEEDIPDWSLGPVDVELYRPVLNVAHHYRWSVAIRLGNEPLQAWPNEDDVQAVIGAPALLEGGSCAIGVDVGTALWSEENLPPLGEKQFYFVEVPRSHQPEQVLEHLARLRV